MVTFCAPNRVEAGYGVVNKLGELIRSMRGVKALVVMDAFLATPAVNLLPKIEGICKEAGISIAVYCGIVSEPTSTNVAEGLKVARRAECDCVVAVGGGSAIDVAKAISVLAVNPELAFCDIPKQLQLVRLPLIAIPTTAGTGSEATRVSVITNADTGIKDNPGHWAMVPDIAVLDAELMLTLPPNLTAFTGMDALTHAVEAYVSNRANALTDLYALEAMKIISQALPAVVKNGLDSKAREQMALASCYAGVAFSNSSTNLAHAGGRALGAYFHVPHGLSVALLLPFVMEFGLEAAEERYASVAIALGSSPHLKQRELARQAVELVCGYNDAFGVWTEAKHKYIRDLAAYRQAIPEIAKNAMAGNGILTNRKVPTEQDVTAVLEKLADKLSK
jgi:alcohol dehydrogenase class IV